MLFGVLNIHKPQGMTSRDVVNRVVRRCPRKTKVGHAGTLDPLATGVLVVAVGPATRLIRYSQEATKSYVGDFCLGLTSDTEDNTGVVKKVTDAAEISEDALLQTLNQFHGIIQQTPPQFSAVKVDGQRAYQVARAGGSVAIESRPARIDSIKLLKFDYPNFTLSIDCGKGTYVRTLGRDIAKALGSDAVMTDLQRTDVGDFTLDSAVSLESLADCEIESVMLDPLLMVDSLKKVQLVDNDIVELRDGKKLTATDWNIPAEVIEVAGVSPDGRLAAVLARKSDAEFAPVVNFVPQLF